MRTRSLGPRTIATVGLGDVSLERASHRGRDPSDVVRRVHEAIEAAVDLIDVAPEADTERMVGDAVRTLRARDRVVVATRVAAIGTGEMLDALPLGYLVERIEAALRSTKLDALPLAQLPLRAAWRSSPAWPELLGTCARLVYDGKVLRWGAISDEPELAEESWLASISIVFSACTRAAAPMLAAAIATPTSVSAPTDPFLAIAMESAPIDLLASIAALQAPRGGGLILPSAPPAAAAAAPAAPVPRSITVFARQPLAGGALAGTIGPGVRFAPHDDRRTLDPAQLEAIAIGVANLAIRTKHEPPAARSCAAARALIETTRRPDNVVCSTVAELALRYVIDRGAVALPRIHRPDDLYELVACGSADPLPPALVARIDELWPDPTT